MNIQLLCEQKKPITRKSPTPSRIGDFGFLMIGDKVVDRDKGMDMDMDMDKQEPAPGKVRVMQQPQRLNLSLYRLQIPGSPNRDIPSFPRDSNSLPGSSLFRVPMSRGRARFPNLHALHRRELVYTYCMAESMSFSPFSN
ncbi:hypothetical protein [Rossellomorea sp. LJF3]|uniref:hypothetical protein n=1 Tax=Rossellomorea sp. LJF3 TaxID=3126099 RepID=UPI00300C76C3